MLTVSEALQIGVLNRAHLIAGSGGLDRKILSVTVMDTPDIVRWLRGGEFLLSNVYVIKDNPVQQVKLVKDLAENGAAALGIKTKRYVETVPETMVDLADQLSLPLIGMPADIPWIDVMMPLYREITNRQAANLEKAHEIHDSFTNAALEGHGVDGVLKILASHTASETAMVDCDGAIISQYPQGSWDVSDIPASLLDPERPGTNRLALPSPGESAYSHPVQAGRQLHGHILARTTRELQAYDLMALEHSATVMALEMSKRQAIAEVESRYRNEFLWDLLNGYVATTETLEARCKHMGIHLGSTQGVMVFDIDSFERYCLHTLKGDEAKARALRERFVKRVQSSVTAALPDSLCVSLSDSVTVIIADAMRFSNRDLIRLADLIRHDALQTLPVTTSVGISRLCPNPLRLADSYREARQALALGREIKGTGHLTHFQELGSYRVLLSNGDRAEGERFYNEIMERLDLYESKHPGLVDTLNAYFRCHGDPARCAQELFVHKNTVRYRLRKIEGLCGISLEDQEHRFNLQLALKLRRLFRPGHSAGESPRQP